MRLRGGAARSVDASARCVRGARPRALGARAPSLSRRQRGSPNVPSSTRDARARASPPGRRRARPRARDLGVVDGAEVVHGVVARAELRRDLGRGRRRRRGQERREPVDVVEEVVVGAAAGHGAQERRRVEQRGQAQRALHEVELRAAKRRVAAAQVPRAGEAAVVAVDRHEEVAAALEQRALQAEDRVVHEPQILRERQPARGERLRQSVERVVVDVHALEAPLVVVGAVEGEPDVRRRVAAAAEPPERLPREDGRRVLAEEVQAAVPAEGRVVAVVVDEIRERVGLVDGVVVGRDDAAAVLVDGVRRVVDAVAEVAEERVEAPFPRQVLRRAVADVPLADAVRRVA